jgi:hypothetical protein
MYRADSHLRILFRRLGLALLEWLEAGCPSRTQWKVERLVPSVALVIHDNAQAQTTRAAGRTRRLQARQRCCGSGLDTKSSSHQALHG